MVDPKFLRRYPKAHSLRKELRDELKASVVASLTSDDRAVARAITILFERQTADERAEEDTKHDNSLGVRANHGHRVAYYGKWLASGRTLSGIHLDRARKLALTYAGSQLFELAALKAGLVRLECRCNGAEKGV
jgi:hypothetical protein